jgi:CRISPR-associated protein Cas2
MYAIVVYDVGEKRVNKVKKILRMYMTWIQNSVFEGEITEAELMEIKRKLKDVIEKDSDAVHFYILKSEKYLRKDTLGTPKAEPEKII